VLSDGKILRNQGSIVRLLSTGQIDSSFHSARPSAELNELVVRPDQKIVIVGGFSNVDGFSCDRIARLNPDGNVDFSFVPTFTGGLPNIAVRLHSDGSIVTASVQQVRRYYPDGRVDTRFSREVGAISALEVDASDRIYFNDEATLFQYNGHFRVLIPAADVPILFEKSSFIDSGWAPLKSVPANTPSEFVDFNFPSTQNAFYRTRPVP
jgi:hypothetical protein